MMEIKLPKTFTCGDCGSEIPIPNDIEYGEIISCSKCGAEYYVWKTSEGLKINYFQLEGEDWGE